MHEPKGSSDKPNYDFLVNFQKYIGGLAPLQAADVLKEIRMGGVKLMEGHRDSYIKQRDVLNEKIQQCEEQITILSKSLDEPQTFNYDDQDREIRGDYSPSIR